MLKDFPDFPSLNFIAIFVTLLQLIKEAQRSTLEACVNIVRAPRLFLPAQPEHVHQYRHKTKHLENDEGILGA